MASDKFNPSDDCSGNHDPSILHSGEIVYYQKPQPIEDIVQQRQQFDQDCRDLQDPKNSSSRLIFVFLRRELLRFHLDRLYSEAYILNVAYIRGVERIQEGETIRNTSAWLRGTAFRIIRELHREQKRSAPFEETTVSIAQTLPLVSKWEDDCGTLKFAFQTLTPIEQRLLNLKIVEEKSWREIREIFRLEGTGDFTEIALRKRKERALIRLRKRYHAIKPL